MNNYILSISDIIKAINDGQCVTVIINGVYYDILLDETDGIKGGQNGGTK